MYEQMESDDYIAIACSVVRCLHMPRHANKRKEIIIMITKQSISLEEFTIRIPEETTRLNEARVMVYEDGRFSMNGRLNGLIGRKRVEVRFTPDASHFAILECENDSGYLFPKSGAKRLGGATEHLKNQGIPLPARYDVWYNEKESFWQGDHVQNPTSSPLKGRSSTKKK